MTKMQRKMSTGYTLIELMIVVAIVAIIAAFAYPSYTQFVIRSKRAAATANLVEIAARQQQFFMDNKRFASNLTRLGYGADTVMVNEDGAVVPNGDADRVYQLSVSAATATTYTLTATPQLRQASKDGQCGSLTMSQDGSKGYSGTGGECW